MERGGSDMKIDEEGRALRARENFVAYFSTHSTYRGIVCTLRVTRVQSALLISSMFVP